MNKERPSSEKRVLHDHTRKGKTFLPPLLSLPVPMSYIDWVGDFVPDLLWLALLIQAHGPDKGLYLGAELAIQAKRERPKAKKRAYCFASAYEGLKDDAAARIAENLVRGSALNDLRSALHPLTSLYPSSPLRFLSSADSEQSDETRVEAVEVLKSVTAQLIDRTTRLAAITQAAAIAVLQKTDKLSAEPSSRLNNLSPILGYPDTPESQAIASVTRAALNGFGGMMREDAMNASSWPSRFWRHGLHVAPCQLPTAGDVSAIERVPTDAADERSSDSAELAALLAQYSRDLTSEVERCWSMGKPDLASPTRGEVLAGLVSREARIVSHMVTNPEFWSPDIGQIMLRCIAESHINLVWLTQKGTPGDFASFIEYGLGQEKLWLEHLQQRIDQRGTTVPGGGEFIKEHLRVVNNEILSAFLPVNVGDWTKTSARDRAIEIGLEDDYYLTYLPSSSALHGMWNTLSQQNLVRCMNPLHRFHRVPVVFDPLPVPQFMQQAVQLMDETLSAWVKDLRVKRQKPTAMEMLSQRLDAFGATELRKRQGKTG